MSESIQYWATTNAGNANSDPAISSSDSQAPNTVATNIRSIMTALAKARLDIFGGLTAGGTANALTVTTNQVLISAQLTGGAALMIKAASANTSPTVTFAPDGLTAAPIKRADGSALAVGSIQAGMFLLLVYNSGTSEWWAANIPPVAVAAGSVLLTSGTWSSQATGDIVLSSYTGYRGFQFVLSGIQAASNSVDFWMRLSSNGGSSYDAGAGNYTFALAGAAGGNVTAAQIPFLNANLFTNGAADGINATITMLNTGAASLKPLVAAQGAGIAGGNIENLGFVAMRSNAQITNAVRFLYSSGNISAGNYAVYGLL